MAKVKHFVDGKDIVRDALQGLTTVNPDLLIDVEDKGEKRLHSRFGGS